MSIKLTVQGQRYDDAIPAYMELQGGYYYNRIDGKLYEKTSFDAWMTANSLTFGTGELGDFPASYLKDFIGLPGTAKPAAPVTLSALTISVTKAPTNADDVGEATVAGGPADKAYIITLTVKGEDSAGDDVQNVTIPKGKTAVEAAALLAAAEADPNVTPSTRGAILVITPTAGKKIAKFTVAIAAK